MFSLKNPTFAPSTTMREAGGVTSDRAYLRFIANDQGLITAQVGLYVASSTNIYTSGDPTLPLTRGNDPHPELIAPIEGFVPTPEGNCRVPDGQTLTFDREEIETGKYGPFKTQTFDRLLSRMGFRLTDEQTRALEGALKDALGWVDQHTA